ncbi:MAG: PhoH family protein [Candidatus Marinimicrobia bacterium]|jgi:PhoH-like ATPase|nr:PhoH family protein [Candidatus Neomarinimicrobiota bacterium]MBT3675027.1 PhoH family protein [Candidatus Neomarinimicrobiota bacterium]MBT3764058.1 PhoH family protein [Candidatus Neomarinimicrobiota bacterium]MBT4069195.1 PhoH family protein [Candidatus Neomarinimicrobiota bacterium]MBT4270192.1 PhoH family protein [Candidatus Neomarinimicrobiota bacterium]
MPKKKKAKILVLDTNVILHDSSCIHHFEENDVAIPITVLEELDNFKRGNEQINFHARDFLRDLDEITGDNLFKQGVSLGQDRGKIRIVVNQTWDEDLIEVFRDDIPDIRILNTAMRLQKLEKTTSVILVTKDTNLRMKAKALGILAQDYTTDKIESVDKIYTGRRTVENLPTKIIDSLYANPFHVDGDKIPEVTSPLPNENFILRNEHKSALATYDSIENQFHKIDKTPAYGITPRNSEQAFALAALINPKIQLVTLSGKAGTGKTLLALAGALEARSQFRQIYLARPIVPLSNKDIGYLPGDIQSKIDPYMQPLWDNLGVIRHQFKGNDPKSQKINEMIEEDKLVITPLAYIRGRSLQKVFFIVDEAQNLTPHEVKTIITRAGEGTKIVFTGDINQIDQPYLDKLSNGLSYLINRMTNQKIFAHITLEKGERSYLADLASDLL